MERVCVAEIQGSLYLFDDNLRYKIRYISIQKHKDSGNVTVWKRNSRSYNFTHFSLDTAVLFSGHSRLILKDIEVTAYELSVK